MILNSQYVVASCENNNTNGADFDGWYPSFVSLGAEAGHTRLTGRVFFMKGCDTGLARTFMARDFVIGIGP